MRSVFLPGVFYTPMGRRRRETLRKARTGRNERRVSPSLHLSGRAQGTAGYFGTQTLFLASWSGEHRHVEASGATVKSLRPPMANATAVAAVFFKIDFSLGRRCW